MALMLSFIPAASAASVEIKNEKTEGYVDVPAVEASFKIAKGLEASKRFDGFESDERNIEIITALIKSPFDTIAENFTQSTLKLRGMEMLSRSDVEINGNRGLLVKALHPEDDIRWGKWILLLENGNATLVVNGVFVSGDERAAIDVETTLKSVVPYGVRASEDAAASGGVQPINEEEGN